MNSPVLTKVGKRYRILDMDVWAEEGMICIEEDNGEFRAVTRSEWRHRAVATHGDAMRCHWRDQRDRMFDAVCKMRDVWKDAKDQGDPTDPEIMRRKIRERKRSSIIIPHYW